MNWDESVFGLVEKAEREGLWIRYEVQPYDCRTRRDGVYEWYRPAEFREKFASQYISRNVVSASDPMAHLRNLRQTESQIRSDLDKIEIQIERFKRKLQ